MSTPIRAAHPVLRCRGRALLTGVTLLTFLACGFGIVTHTLVAQQSIARIWDERALAAIRKDTPHPPAQARNLFSLSVCMYDAWAAYDTNAVGFIYHAKHTATDVAAARHAAISYAAYHLLKERHVYSVTASNTLAADDALMTSLGYDTNYVLRDTSDPRGVGNTVYDAVSLWFSNDGSRQTNGIPYPLSGTNNPTAYPDYPTNQGGYVFLNGPIVPELPGIYDNNLTNSLVDVNHWQRLHIVFNAQDQNGFVATPVQKYLGAQWLGVRPYALARLDPTLPWIDPGPPPFFGGATHAQFVKEVVAVITASSQLTPDDGVMIDISPAAYGNNSLDNNGGVYGDGTLDIYDGHGYTNNPVTQSPYASDVVKRGDYVRVLSEFWADGPNSETPPGHWNVVANNVADSPLTVKKIGGTGPVVDDLEWDVKVYFALNAGVHEAACACWAVKRFYDGWRPLSAIRYLGGLGQSSDPSLTASYNANGLPLITNLIEVVTPASIASGRHAGLTLNKIAVLCWPGKNPPDRHQGVVWMHADEWKTYQRTNFVTPAFPGYISGHSTFSRSAAEVLTAITGSKFFPGGLGSYTVTNLANEQGPSQSVTMQWATYYDAADGAGLSRIYGGIHPPIDNLGGRLVGEMVGKGTWEAARKYFDGSITSSPVNLALQKVTGGQGEVRYNTLRGFYYKLQSSTNLNSSFGDDFAGPVLAYDSSQATTNTLSSDGKFYRVIQSPTP